MTPEQNQEYNAAIHKIQSCAAYEYGQKLLSDKLGHKKFKHLRVGVNSVMRDLASLTRLLVKKGFITHEEYCEAIVQGMKEEADLYEAMIREQYNLPNNVTFA